MKGKGGGRKRGGGGEGEEERGRRRGGGGEGEEERGGYVKSSVILDPSSLLRLLQVKSHKMYQPKRMPRGYRGQRNMNGQPVMHTRPDWRS